MNRLFYATGLAMLAALIMESTGPSPLSIMSVLLCLGWAIALTLHYILREL